MRIISRKMLRDFWEDPDHRDSEQPLKAWFAEAKAAKWSNPADVLAHYRTASPLRDSRMVFNIGGNKYRLVVRIQYNVGIAYIRFVGTHKQYDLINAEKI